jgi:hypothetical protein
MGFDHGYLCAIEAGRRAPSGQHADAIINVLEPDEGTAAALRAFGSLVDEGRQMRAANRARRPRRHVSLA